MFYALAILYSTIFCTLHRLIIAVDVIDPYNYEYKVEGDQYRVGEMYEYRAKGAYRVPLPDAVKQVVIYSVSGENSGYAKKVSYQTEGRGKHGENKVEERKPNNNRRYSQLSDDFIYTTTDPHVIMDTAVIPSPDTVTNPALFDD